VNLSRETIKVNSKYFKNQKIPKKALTMGIGTIMRAKKIILLVSGKEKVRAINCLLKCKPNKCCPVSFLKKHKNLIIIDEKARS
jgi:glucosamine-6-phosphate deaminase